VISRPDITGWAGRAPRRLAADVVGDGGFALTLGVVTNAAKPECTRAMIEAGKKYGPEVRGPPRFARRPPHHAAGAAAVGPPPNGAS
jgi:hypothetical protein